MSVVLIGERPGLSSPDSLGLYFTYAPGLRFNGACRNCILQCARGQPERRPRTNWPG